MSTTSPVAREVTHLSAIIDSKPTPRLFLGLRLDDGSKRVETFSRLAVVRVRARLEGCFATAGPRCLELANEHDWHLEDRQATARYRKLRPRIRGADFRRAGDWNDVQDAAFEWIANRLAEVFTHADGSTLALTMGPRIAGNFREMLQEIDPHIGLMHFCEA